MQFAGYTQIDEIAEAKVSDELDALAWAEELCDRAQALHDEAAAEAAQIMAKAKADAARLIRHAMAVIDENVARSEAARNEQEMHRAAAEAARIEAETILDQARATQRWMAAEQLDQFAADLHLLETAEGDRPAETPIVDLTAPSGMKMSYGVLADLAR